MNDLSFYHGAVLFNVLKDPSYKSVRIYQGNRSSYLVNNKSGLYVKYSKKAMTPWHFTFSAEHMHEISAAHDDFGGMYIVLACGEDGICCLNWDEFRTVISIESTQFPKWVSVSRMEGEKYAVNGSEGRLTHKIGKSDFPRKIFETD